ncbi:MAG: hypothetical protein MUC87_21800 [Bacteroidia bacterium]|jgi:hypothetical protein|nr:hypothetical protein [Bacteroidia bacterium]
MIKTILACFVAVTSLGVMPLAAQPQPAPAQDNCYTRWEEKFEQRGAEAVTDGTHDNVIISIRSGSEARCYNARVEVKDGKVIAMYRLLDNGTYEAYKPKLKYDVPATIVNGISATQLTQSEELVNVIFPKTLKPKKAGYTTAPDPPQD